MDLCSYQAALTCGICGYYELIDVEAIIELTLLSSHLDTDLSTTGCFEYGQGSHDHQGATRNLNDHLVVSALETYYVSLHHQLAPRQAAKATITSHQVGVERARLQTAINYTYTSCIHSTSPHHVSQRSNHRRFRHRIRFQQPCEEPTPRCQDGRSSQRYVELLSVRPFFCRFEQADRLWNHIVYPVATSTGTTIVGVKFGGGDSGEEEGVCLGADTRATGGPIVADKNCEKVSPSRYHIGCVERA